MTTDEHGRPPQRRREPSTRKRRAIIEAATTAFLRNGYLGTSMDEIAALAGVSKQTVYKHFADKERLFSEIVVSDRRRGQRSRPRRGASTSRTAATSRPISATWRAGSSPW